MENEWLTSKGVKLKKPLEVRGYEKLGASTKKIFELFLKNFYKAWEAPEEHIPVRVALKKDAANGSYLKVDFKDGTWLHVKGPNTWY